MEHHANDLPWRKTSTVEYVDIDEFKEMINNNYVPEYLKYFIK